MKCPVCKRELAATLSICFTCGTMVNDTVREELQTKIGRVSQPLEQKIAAASLPAMSSALSEKIISNQPSAQVPLLETERHSGSKPVKSETSEFFNKQTSQTLVEFQTKSAMLPDWRLQLQNAVRQRKSDDTPDVQGMDKSSRVFQKQLVVNGANALKPQFTEEPETILHDNPRVANALRRIEDSRRRFSSGTSNVENAATPSANTTAARSYPFNVVARSGDMSPAKATPRATINTPPKPRLVTSLRIEKKGYDTNKLPRLSGIDKIPDHSAEFKTSETAIPSSAIPAKIESGINIRSSEQGAMIESVVPNIPETDEIDDLAPLSSRFTAGLFDTIIGGFATAILLSPLILSGGAWLSLSGLLAVSAAFGIVMFTYLTASIGFRGRTLGMRLFSLEIIDAEENEYPTLHQAAVNSAVFLLTFPLLGIGFVPAFFNEERRAAHDLIAGTILVREV